MRRALGFSLLISVRFVAMESRKAKYPKTLEGFGYDFNSAGQLRRIDPKTKTLTDEPYEFEVSSRHAENQERYDALGDVITDYVYKLLETEAGLRKLPVPKNAGEKGSFIFVSPDFFTNKKLMILFNGNGVVRAGQWARSLIINDSLKTGTQLPFIKKALEENYSILVMNTNENERLVNGRVTPIPGSEDPLVHACTVWEQYVLGESKAEQIFIVAHSFGGVATIFLADKHLKSFQEKVVAIALTDSVHDFNMCKISRKTFNFLIQVARNWAASNKPLDTIITREDDIPAVSAGHDKHVMTSYCSMDSIFKFFRQRFSAVIKSDEL